VSLDPGARKFLRPSSRFLSLKLPSSASISSAESKLRPCFSCACGGVWTGNVGAAEAGDRVFAILGAGSRVIGSWLPRCQCQRGVDLWVVRASCSMV
jgi:hypothetical protein